MLNPADLLTAVVARLRDIPELVAVLDGDANNIYAYSDAFPTAANFREALIIQRRPSIMVMWQETGPGAWAKNEVWKHRFSLFIAASNGISPFALMQLLVSGVPAALGVRMLNAQIHASVLPMDTPRFSRGFLVTDVTGSTLDYYEMSLTLTERGDT